MLINGKLTLIPKELYFQLSNPAKKPTLPRLANPREYPASKCGDVEM